MTNTWTPITASRPSGFAGFAASRQIDERLGAYAGPVMGSAVAKRDHRDVTQASCAATGATRGFATATSDFRLWRPPIG